MLSEHIQHGDIWESGSGKTVFVVQIPESDFYIFSIDGGSKQLPVDTPLSESPFDPTASGAKLKWRAPEANKNNFNLTGDDARVLSAALMILNKEQTRQCQSIMNSLQPIIQAQPPSQG